MISTPRCSTQCSGKKAANAEIFRRLIATIERFNNDADRVQRMMLYLAISQVILAVAQVILAIVQFR